MRISGNIFFANKAEESFGLFIRPDGAVNSQVASCRPHKLTIRYIRVSFRKTFSPVGSGSKKGGSSERANFVENRRELRDNANQWGSVKRS